ncbi:hypothetical protein HY489_03170 [Candidatus Woesearchaeota archaeon]|nr:hypothetical protein [Candidatus Woesearchaeota archaeon]
MATYQEVTKLLVDLGLLDVILPFLLVFSITYGILQRTKALGGKKNTDAMLGFVFGFLAVLATNVLNIIQTLTGYLVIVLVVALMMSLLLGLVGASTGTKYYLGLLAALFIIGTLAGLVQAGVITNEQFISSILLPLIVGGALIGVVVYLLREEKEKEAVPKKKAEPKLKPIHDISPKGKEGVLLAEPEN